MTQVNVPVGMSKFVGAGGISVQLPKGSSLASQINTLSQQPGNEYMADLAKRSDIDWKQVEVINKTWDYKKSGLTQEAAIIVAIVVTIFTAGAASSAAGSIVGTAGTATATGTGLAAATGMSAGVAAATTTAVAAGITTLATQATIALINSQGDIGAALKELGSKENVKNLAVAMVTAGLVKGIGIEFGLDKVTAKSPFIDQLSANLVNSVTGSLVSTAINGGSLEQNLINAIKTGLISTAGAIGADAIGTATNDGKLNQTAIDKFANQFAHAVLGCALGAAQADSQAGCGAGALGAVAGNLGAELFDPSNSQDPIKKAQTQQFAKLTASLAVMLTTSDAKLWAIGGSTAVNAVANNRQLHPEERKLAAELAAKSGGKYTAKQIEDAMRNSGNTKYGENITAGMFIGPNDPKAVYDSGAVWNKGEDGKLYQIPPNNGAVNADLAAFIQTNTGNTSTPYGWTDGQLGKVTPNTNTPTDSKRDARTGLPLDDQGRITTTKIVDGKPFVIKVFPCGSLDCTNTNTLDLTDPSTKAFAAASYAQFFKDASEGVNYATLFSPPGAIRYLAIAGGTASLGSAMTDSSIINELLKYGSQEGATKLFTNILGHSPSAAARAVAAIDLQGGWDAFVNRVKIDLLEIKPTTAGGAK